MALIDDVKATCSALAGLGFGKLLLQVSGGELDITASDLAAELAKPLSAIDRTVAGFEDFAQEGVRGIEPGQPALSLLYHALASPCVATLSDGEPLTGFPTPAQIETVEDYVYGASPPTLAEIAARWPGAALAVGVFALEYRPGARTPHGKHADLCLSRTGIARAGTAAALYEPATRQFLPLDVSNPYAFRVLPARYAPFVAVQQAGRQGALPFRFMPGDDQLSFWVPVQKLFSGEECLAGLDLTVSLSASHVNAKIGRLHSALGALGYETGWQGPDLGNPPFVFTDGIAELADDPELGGGFLLPAVSPGLVAPAVYQGKPLTISIPKDLDHAQPASTVLENRLPHHSDADQLGRLARYFSGLELTPEYPFPGESPDQTLRSTGDKHPGPEIVNVRHQVLADGTEVNLNDQPDIQTVVSNGGYDAQHYVDFTGDGWIGAACPALDTLLPTRLAAYSIVAGPDFFPYCDQLQLMEWWATLPEVIRIGLWAVPPRALSDTRHAANVTLAGSGFDTKDANGSFDSTVTAIVCPPGAESAAQRPCPEPTVLLRGALPDSASGVFDPGWDVTTDTLAAPQTPETGDVQLYLAGYGLGTPFVEDAKICAALGTFWPAVAPDATRTFQPDRFWPTISPLTDEEIGIVGDMPWDGITGPVKGQDFPNGPEYVVFTDIDYADYVDQALAGRVTAALTARIDFAEYARRVLAMAWIYWALGLRLPPEVDKNGKKMSYFQRIQAFQLAKAGWNVLSFRAIPGSALDPAVQKAIDASGTPLGDGPGYWCEAFRHGADDPGSSFKLRHVEIVEEAQFYTDLVHVWMSRAGAPWVAQTIPTS